MLTFLEELTPYARKLFLRKVHLNEVTSFSINAAGGKAIVLTNRYLYLIYKGFLKGSCHKLSPGELLKAEVKARCLIVATRARSYQVELPPDKTVMLPEIARRINRWLLDKNEKLKSLNS